MTEHIVPFNDEEFRDVMGHFCTGVVVVTSMRDDQPVGLTCQSFVSVSLSPPLVLFCPAHSSTSWPSIHSSGRFCINVLADDQAGVCATFAKTGGSKFESVEWSTSDNDLPTLTGCLAHIECSIEDVRTAGDHDIVLGRVLNLRIGAPGAPLLFYRGNFPSVTL